MRITRLMLLQILAVSLKEVDTNIIRVSGGSGTQRPATFKVSVGYQAFYLGEGEISYAGPNALGRAKLAGEIVKQRLSTLRHECKIDLLGYSAIHGQQFNQDIEPYEVRLRVVAKAMSQGEAARIGEEVEALYTNGPAGGGGVRKYVNDVIGIVSTLIDRHRISHTVTIKST